MRLLAQQNIQMILIDLSENIERLNSISKQAVSKGAKVYSYGMDIRDKDNLCKLINIKRIEI